ncbi:hypothetical protein H5T89_05260 [bacterium]|nr:hypothetical protein [bacterium]
MRISKAILSIFLLTVFFSSFSLARGSEPDASIVIRQETLNRFLDTIGEVKKTDSFSIIGIKGEYTWTVKNPKIILTAGRARFQAEVTVSFKSLPVNYSTPAYGEVSIRYDSNENKINIKVEKVAFEVAFNVLGKRVVVGEVDISKIYQIAFSFPGPKPFESLVEVSLPDGSRKKIKIESVPVLVIEDGRIVVGSEINYTPIQ